MRELAHSESWILVTLAVSSTDAEKLKKKICYSDTYFQIVVSGLENHTKCLKIQKFTDIKNSKVKQLWDGEIFVL